MSIGQSLTVVEDVGTPPVSTASVDYPSQRNLFNSFIDINQFRIYAILQTGGFVTVEDVLPVDRVHRMKLTNPFVKGRVLTSCKWGGVYRTNGKLVQP